MKNLFFMVSVLSVCTVWAATVDFEQSQAALMRAHVERLREMRNALQASMLAMQRATQEDRPDYKLRECVEIDGVQKDGMCAVRGFYFKGEGQGVDRFMFADDAAMVVPVAQPVYDTVYVAFDCKDLQVQVKPNYWNQQELYSRGSVFASLLGGIIGGLSAASGAIFSSMNAEQKVKAAGVGVLVGSVLGAAGGFAGAKLFQQNGNIAVRGFETTVYRKLPKKKKMKATVILENGWCIEQGADRIPLLVQKSIVQPGARQITRENPVVYSYSESWIGEHTQREKRA
jgi:hypothetical protein